MQDIETWAPVSTLLQILASEDWEALRGDMSRREFVPGAVLVAQGTLEPDFQVINDGVTSVVATTPQGERRELGRLGAGECIGEMSLLTGEPASADVVALTHVTTYASTPAHLASLGELRVRLIQALSTILASRLKRANERLLTRHPAHTHIIHCRPDDLHALGGLPRAVAEAANVHVMVLIVGEAMTSAARAFIADAAGVTLRRVDEPELIELPAMLAGLGHEYQEVLVFTDVPPHSITSHGASVLHVARAGQANGLAPEDKAAASVVVVGGGRWTQPALRTLARQTGQPVIGVLPEDGSGGGDAHAPIARLARVMTNRRVGIALGAGAAKGLAHLGVLRALDEIGVCVDVISGCSIGSPMAAGWAAGLPVDELTRLADRIARRALRPTLPIRSFLSNKGVRDELAHAAAGRRFEDLDIPLALVATDLYRRSEVTFTSGPLLPAILASMALPGVYPPIAANGSYLVDGGVLNPVPVAQARELGAGVVIGVRLTGKRTSPREQLDVRPGRPFAVETISRVMEIMHNRISEMSNVQADVTVEICIEGGGIRDFRNGQPIIDQGYAALMEARSALAGAMPYVGAAAS
jgi:NTE family protein